MSYKLHQGDCLEVLRKMPDASIDAVVTDPPYGLAFMGKRWDYDVPSVEIWEECLRVLKPGGHLLAFAGTRTQHRMAVRIEDAGFEIRDMIAWVYGSGFPKSHNVSRAIDKIYGQTGSEGPMKRGGERLLSLKDGKRDGLGKWGNESGRSAYTIIPTTEDAKRWDGWGTALKPAIETVTFASKPYTDEQARGIIQSNLFRLEARLWLLSSASAAGKSSTSNQSEYGAACAIAQWSADEITSIRADLCGQMGTSLFALATTTSLNIVSSWRRILAESWSDGNTSTTETKSSTTTDWKTLRFSLSQITVESIIKACSLPGGFSANASTAESHFNASLLLLQSILTLSVTERAMSQAQREHRDAGVKPNLDPCIMARKPFKGTVAANVLEHGTGALNIDGCRVGEEKGRWPANFIHDGSDEVLALFPETSSGSRKAGVRSSLGFGSTSTGDGGPALESSTGSAARFFYCAKASKKDRGEGNNHPTVKPTDLMRYLCRLVTPPGGTVLDPFMGSGSTGKAAMIEGFSFIGIEREAEYIAIARARIEEAAQ